jgi:hypothetical protein
MFEEILSKIGAILKRHNIPYMIIGGQAVLLYGEPRLKNPDIDTQYIRSWLKEFDSSSEKKDFLNTFEDVLKD